MNEKQGDQIPPQHSGQTPQPVIPVQPNQAQMSKAPENPKTKSNLTILWVALGMFVLGVIGGILLVITYPKFLINPQSRQPTNLTAVPTQPVSTTPSTNLSIAPDSSVSSELAPIIDIDTTSWKTYINKVGLYNFQYPSDWEVRKENMNNKDIKDTLTISPKTSPCPTNSNPSNCESTEIIYIDTIESSEKYTSLTDYLSQYNDLNKSDYSSIMINGAEGLRTSSIPGRYEQENVFIMYNKNIYNIVWIKTPTTLASNKITEGQFNKILDTFKFQE